MDKVEKRDEKQSPLLAPITSSMQDTLRSWSVSLGLSQPSGTTAESQYRDMLDSENKNSEPAAKRQFHHHGPSTEGVDCLSSSMIDKNMENLVHLPSPQLHSTPIRSACKEGANAESSYRRRKTRRMLLLEIYEDQQHEDLIADIMSALQGKFSEVHWPGLEWSTDKGLKSPTQRILDRQDDLARLLNRGDLRTGVITKVLEMGRQTTKSSVCHTLKSTIFHLFPGSWFLHRDGTLQAYCNRLLQESRREITENTGQVTSKSAKGPLPVTLVCDFIENVARFCPETIPSVLRTIKCLTNAAKYYSSSLLTCRVFNLYHKLLQLATESVSSPADMDWRQLGTLPTAIEIEQHPIDEKGKIPSTTIPDGLMVRQRYASVSDYLDTYYRLLRLDCHDKLLQGLQTVRNSHSSFWQHSLMTFSNIEVSGVQVLRFPPGIMFAVKVRELLGRSKKWEKQAMKGSLIGILSDAGDTVDFAIVAQTPCHGYDLWLSFLSPAGLDTAVNRGLHSLLTAGCSATLVESPTYYKAYSPVLQALSDIDICTQLPFQDVLLSSSPASVKVTSNSVGSNNPQQAPANTEQSAMSFPITNCDADDKVHHQALSYSSSGTADNHQLRKESFEEKSAQPWCPGAPAFLTTESTLDWSLVFEALSLCENKKVVDHELSRKQEEDDSSEELDTQSDDEEAADDQLLCDLGIRLPVSRFDELSKIHKSDLDKTQLKAIEVALTQKVVLIQGPPGTGKTFIGCKYVELLLSLRPKLPGPILVMTYKNHALEEFLRQAGKLDVVSSAAQVLRIGGKIACNDNASTSADARSHGRVESIYGHVSIRDGYVHLPGHATRPGFKGCHDKLDSTEKAVRCSAKHLSNVTAGLSVDMLLEAFCKHGVFPFLISECPRSKWHQLHRRSKLREVAKCKDYRGLDLKAFKARFGEDTFHCLCSLMNTWVSPAKQLMEVSFQKQKAEKSRKLKTSKRHTVVMEKTQNDQKADDLCRLNEMDEEDKTALFEEREIYDFYRHKQHRHMLPDRFVELSHELDYETLVSAKLCQLYMHNHNVEPSSKHCNLRRRHLWEMADHERACWICCVWQQAVESATNHLQRDAEDHEIECEMHCAWKAEDMGQLIHDHAKVVGVTTTGAALHRQLLSAVKPSVVLIEEAAEIMEPQVLAAIPTSAKQLVMIGDHKQLRPHVESYLAKKRGLEKSMFERLCQNGHPTVVLHLQSRMRDEIAELIRVLKIYPRYETNPRRTANNKPPSCMRSSLFFWTHRAPQFALGHHHINVKEAKMVVWLAVWLIEEDVAPDRLTILAAYRPQVRLIRQLITNKFGTDPLLQRKVQSAWLERSCTNRSGRSVLNRQCPVRVESIDNYQGDENDVIVLSLVRSQLLGSEDSIGYLKTTNRLCVAISRARCGLYVVGNTTLLEKKSEEWCAVIDHLRKKDPSEVGDKIPLVCKRHPQTAIFKDASDQSLQDSVCWENCRELMECGIHRCPEKCHDHSCSANVCKVKVEYTHSSCGHTDVKECSQNEIDLPCRKPCNRSLQCGHLCFLACHENCQKAASNCKGCAKLRAAEEKEARRRHEEIRGEWRKEIIKQIQQLRECQTLVEALDPDKTDHHSDYHKVCQMMASLPSSSAVAVVTKIEKITPQTAMMKKWLNFRKQMIWPDRQNLMFLQSTQRSIALEYFHEFGDRFPQRESDGVYVCESGASFTLDPVWTVRHPTEGNTLLAFLYDVLVGKAHEESMKTSSPKIFNYGNLKRYQEADIILLRDTPITLADGSQKNIEKYITLARNQALPAFIVHYHLYEGATYELLRKLPENKKVSISREDKENTKDLLFRLAESQFHRALPSNCCLLKPSLKVTQVDCYHNPTLIKRYEHKHCELKGKGYGERRLVFHGTQEDNIDSILVNGFKVGGVDTKVANGKVFGNGIYTAVDPTLSNHYARGSNRQLMVEVLPGRPTRAKNNPDEYDSYEGPYHTGETILVLYTPEQALPCFVVHYTDK